MAHVIKTMRDTLPEDPWHKYYGVPGWLQALIVKGALGQKTRGGIYRKDGKEIKVLDLARQDYVPAVAQVDAEVQAILKLKNPAEKFAKLRAHASPQAQFLWAIFRDVFHYCACHLGDIADNARDVDFAMRWGFGWSQGPFETWQAAGWIDTANAIKAGYRRRPGDERHAVAGLGLGRRKSGPPRRARAAGLLVGQRGRTQAALHAGGVQAPAFSRARPRRAARRRFHGVRERRRTLLEYQRLLRARDRHPLLQEQDVRPRSRRGRGRDRSGGPCRGRLPRPGDLAAEGTVLRGRQSPGPGSGPRRR